MKDLLVLRVVAKLIIPFITLFGLYIQLHGEVTPGGGFQSGIIIAASLILYGLIFGLNAAQRVYPKWLVVRMGALGLLVYAGTGAYTLALGGELLNYSVMGHDAQHGQHLGLFLIELGVCLAVTHVMILIYYAFGGHQLTLASRREQ